MEIFLGGVLAGATITAVIVGILLYRLGEAPVVLAEDDAALARVADDVRIYGTGVAIGIPDPKAPSGIRIDRMDPRGFEVRLRQLDDDQAGNH